MSPCIALRQRVSSRLHARPQTPRKKLSRQRLLHKSPSRPTSAIYFHDQRTPRKRRRSIGRSMVLLWKRLSQYRPLGKSRRFSFLPPDFDKIHIHLPHSPVRHSATSTPSTPTKSKGRYAALNSPRSPLKPLRYKM